MEGHEARTAARSPLLILDCMGGELGLATCEKLARAVPPPGPAAAVGIDAAPSLPAERVPVREPIDYALLLSRAERGAIGGIVYTGSKDSVYDQVPWIRALEEFTRELLRLADPPPVLGICFGHQMLALAGGGAVVPRPPVLRTVVEVEVVDRAPPFDALAPRFHAVVSHQDHVADPGPDLLVTATAAYTKIHALRHPTKPIYSVQAHPEHDRHLMDLDERLSRHGAWSRVSDDVLQGCEAPRVLARFGELCAAWPSR